MFGLLLVALLFCGSLSQEDAQPVQETQTGRLGGFVALKCGVSYVVWRKNVEGEQIKVKKLRDRRFIMQKDGTMYISRLQESDEAVYTCFKFETPIKEITVKLPGRPTISITPSDVTAHIGDLVHLPCEGTGDPTPSIEWNVGRTVLTDLPVIPDDLSVEEIKNYRGDNFLMTENGHLYIRDITATHSAQYTCVVTNAGGNIWATARVNVIVTPKLRLAPKDAWVPFGNSAVFSCTASGNPTPVIEWFKDNQYLPFSTTYQIQHFTSPGEVQERLLFRFVQFEDTGVYECRASSVAGTSRHEFSLAVTGKLKRDENFSKRQAYSETPLLTTYTVTFKFN